jgi:hypothetical protein
MAAFTPTAEALLQRRHHRLGADTVTDRILAGKLSGPNDVASVSANYPAGHAELARRISETGLATLRPCQVS